MATPGSPAKKIRVLVVDDSAIIRAMIQHLLAKAPDIEVVGLAADPFEAREKVIALSPDVITLDIDMPRMDGLTFLPKLMAHVPTPVVIVSALVDKDPSWIAKARAAGAVKVIGKPQAKKMEEGAREILAAVREAALGGLIQRTMPSPVPAPVTDAMRLASQAQEDGVLVIASSTGGTEALRQVLSQLPADLPPTVVVQHLPPNFTQSYARQLNDVCPFEVREARASDTLRRGLVLLAPGDHHLEVVKRGNLLQVRLHREPHLHGVRPAGDYLFKSVAAIAAKTGLQCWGAILTGMGRDGAAGMLDLRKAGARTIAQDEASCVVFGMPKAAIELGAAEEVLPLDRIAARLTDWIAQSRRKKAA